LTVTTDKAEEVPYLEAVVACTDRQSTSAFLANNADVAWTLHARVSSPVDQLDNGIAESVFRASAAEITSGAVLAPRTSVIVFAPPAEVEWLLDPGLSAMWLAQSQLMDVVRAHAQEQFTALVSPDSHRRHALAECGFAAYGVAGASGQFIDQADPVGQLIAAMGIGAEGTRCAAAWRKADEADVARFGSAPRWGDDVARLADDAVFLQRATNRLTLLRRIGNAALLLR